jgi:2-keto-4-pentenoate hydratase
VIDEMTASSLAAELLSARRARRTLAPLSERIALTMDDAYRIQRSVTAARVARGERVVGWKLGYTSAAMREQMGVEQPNYGPLTDRMLLDDGSVAGDQLTQPRVEPEIGFFLAHALTGADITRDDALAAVEAAVACLEVVDSVYTGYRFRVEDNTADGSSAAEVVVGPELGGDVDLADVDVVFARNGERVGTARGSAAMGHPAESLAWLARRQPLEAGQLVITGGLTAAVPLGPGDECSALFGGSARVTVRGSEPT